MRNRLFHLLPIALVSALCWPLVGQSVDTSKTNKTKSLDRQSLANAAQEQKSDTRSKTKSKVEANASANSRDPQKLEEATLKFVSQHQPRLVVLLDYMQRNKQNSQYQQALREISRTVTRLEGLKKRDSEMHAIELGLWKVDSELRLLAAKIATLSKEDDLKSAEAKLATLVRQQHKKSLARLKLQRKRAAAQVAKYETQIDEREGSSEELIAKSIKLWQNRIAKQKPKTKTRSKKPTDSK